MRIVAGAAKGRRLSAPAQGTRPTSDRAREAMFNTLAATMRLDGARVLDLFAGTGAVGLEALSRGAEVAVFVERARAALVVLRQNIETVGLPGAMVVGRGVAQYLAEAVEAPFDLVFADPPYALGAAEILEMLDAVGARGVLSPDAIVVVERSARSSTESWGTDSITPMTEKRYGDSLLWYGRAR